MREFERAAEKRRKKALKKRVKEAAQKRCPSNTSVSALRRAQAVALASPEYVQMWVDEIKTLETHAENLSSVTSTDAGRGWGKRLKAEILKRKLSLAAVLGALAASAGCEVAR